MKKAPILNLRIYDYKNLEELAQVCQEYYDRMYQCESQKYDMEFECRKKDFEVEWLEFCPCRLAVSPCLNEKI